MNVLELVRGWFEDVLRLPLLFKLFLLYAAGAAAWQWWKARQQAEVIAASAAWPVYRARVVWAQVSDRKSGGEGDSSYWEGLLTYSYTVPGHDLEVGEFRKRFDDEDEANAWARALRDTQVDVRVDLADVKRSVWQETPVVTVPPLRAPELDGARLQGIEHCGWREALAAVIFCVALLGAFYAAWIQISCLIGKPLLSAARNTPVFFGMHVGAILCAIAVGSIGKRSGRSRQTWQKSLSTGKTGIGMKVLGAYMTVVFFYGWVKIAANDGDSQYLVVLVFSAGWLLFYLGAAAGCLQVLTVPDGDAS